MLGGTIQNDEIYLTGMVASIDGKRLIKDESRGNINYQAIMLIFHEG